MTGVPAVPVVPDVAAGGGRAGEPEVDLVIAVHTAQRPIARAVGSALASRAAVRVTVVCHNVDAALIDANLAQVTVPPGSSVRTVELRDATRSPSGPFNRGLDLATAPYVAVMGSDDRLAPGAVDSWLALARRTGSAAVVARLARVGGRDVPTPPVRPWRTTRLDGVRDRLSYRSAPLGLLDRAVLDREQIRFAVGLEVGEDVCVVTRLWFGSGPVAFDRRGPAYLVEDDAGDRTTAVQRPVERELAFVHDLLDRDWWPRLRAVERAAVCAKVLRIHVFGIVLNREPAFWDHAEREALAATARRVLASAPGCERVLSRADRALLDAVLDPGSTPAALASLARARRRHGRPATLVTRDLRHLLAREAPLRLMVASVLV